MSEPEVRFRTAAVGGFNRQDVLDYITKSTQCSQEEKRRLEAQVSELQQRQEENRDCQSRLLRLAEDCDSLRRENAALKAQQESDKQALSRLQEELERQQPQLQTYAAIRSQMADIELDARGRSYNIITAAQNRASQLCREANERLDKLRRDYAGVQTDVEATLAHLREELSRVEEALLRLEGAMDGCAAELGSLHAEQEDESHE